MPIVEVNGQELEFPDTMGQDEIKSVLQKKFPTSQAAPAQQEQVNPVNDMMAGIIKSLAGRTGRIATGIAGGLADLPVTVAQSAYDTTRSLQDISNTSGFGANLPNQVAPAYKIPLPSEALKGAYDVATNNAGNVGSSLDTAAETIVPLAAAGSKIIPALVKQAVPRAQGITKQLAQRATDLGIPLRIDQIAPSRAMNTAQKISQEIPFSGVDASEANQTLAFNKAVAKTLGLDTDNLAPEAIKQFKINAHSKFSNVLAGQPVNVDSTDVAKIKNIKQIAPNSIGADSMSIVNSNINQALKDIKEGTLTGEKLADVRSYFLNNAIDAEGGAKKFIGKIVSVIDDIASKNISPEKLQELQTARKEWKNYRTVEPLLKTSVDGNINPVQLLQAAKNNKYINASEIPVGQDELVDLGRIGKRFLVKKGGSDTFQKAAGAGGVGGLVTMAATNPALALQAATLAGGGMAANRGLQAMNNSQDLVHAALTNRNFDPRMSQLLTALTASSLTKGD